jgi:hypothetical protein
VTETKNETPVWEEIYFGCVGQRVSGSLDYSPGYIDVIISLTNLEIAYVSPQNCESYRDA